MSILVLISGILFSQEIKDTNHSHKYNLLEDHKIQYDSAQYANTLQKNSTQKFNSKSILPSTNTESPANKKGVTFKFNLFKGDDRIYRDNFTNKIYFQNGFDRTLIYSRHLP